MIAEKQAQTNWGDKLIGQVANDLKVEFPDMSGLSISNLKYCKRFYLFHKNLIGQQPVDQLVQQFVGLIPWGHNILIFSKSKDVKEAHFYIRQTIENGWSRDTLSLQIKGNLYTRQGKAVQAASLCGYRVESYWFYTWVCGEAQFLFVSRQRLTTPPFRQHNDRANDL